MKYLKQFMIIMCVSAVGEVIKHFVHLPIPASIYGLVLMFILLSLKIIRLSMVEDAAMFLISIMPVMFVPLVASLSSSWHLIKNIMLPLCVIIPVTTLLVMAVTGKSADFLLRLKNGKNTSHENSFRNADNDDGGEENE